MSLLKHQKESIEHLSNWSVGALFMEAGTGKTRVAASLIDRIDSDLVLYVCPLRVIDNTIAELKKWKLNIERYKFVGIESIGQSSRIYLEVRNLVLSAKSPFIVVDESLKIKNADAQRTKRLLDLGSLVKYKLVLNGTPLSKNLLDIWSQMEFLSPRILNMSLAQFKNTFCKYTTITKSIGRKSYTKEFITGYENIDFLYSLIRHYVYEANLSLTISQNYQDVKYYLSKKEKSDYNSIKEKFLSDDTLEWKNNNIFLEMTQKMQHSYCVATSKFQQLDELFGSIPENRTIIFCKYIASREACEKRYPKAMVLSYQTAALGLNLQEYCHTVYFDKTWDFATRTQASHRTYRTGQEYDCKYYDLTGDIGLDSLIDKNIKNKVSMLEYFKNKTKEELYGEL